MNSPSMPPAGWYPDPANPAPQLRYWDGAGWTEASRVLPPPPAQIEPTLKMRIADVFKSGWSGIFDYRSKTDRKDFWTWQALAAVMALPAAALILVDLSLSPYKPSWLVVISGVLALGILLPSMAILVRRLNDVGRREQVARLIVVPHIFFVGAHYLAEGARALWPEDYTASSVYAQMMWPAGIDVGTSVLVLQIAYLGVCTLLPTRETVDSRSD